MTGYHFWFSMEQKIIQQNPRMGRPKSPITYAVIDGKEVEYTECSTSAVCDSVRHNIFRDAKYLGHGTIKPS